MFYALAVAVLGMLLMAPFARGAESPPHPNIVFILVDDLRWDALGCAGHPFVKTPHIDRLAAEGVRFRNAFVTTPICLPSRACFLTGKYAHAHGVTGSGDHTARSYQLETFPKLLQQAGYETAYVGKWHIGDDARPRPGFDRWVSFLGQGKYVDPELNVDGHAVQTKGYMTDLLTDHALDVIQSQHEKPWLLYLAYTAVHAPFIPAVRHEKLFAQTPIVRASSVSDMLETKPILRREFQFSPNDPDVSTSDDNIRNQLRCLMAVDEGIGRIVEALQETGQLDQTLVVFTSDHGYFWGEHGLGGKHGPYEEALRIPLLMRYPKGIRAGTTIDALVLNLDVAPTLLELGAAALPQHLHGRSLLPLLNAADDPWRSSFLAEYFYNPGQTARFPTWQAVRTERWKYIRYPGHKQMDELYDLAADPLELRNLIDDAEAKATLQELKSDLERLLTQST